MLDDLIAIAHEAGAHLAKHFGRVAPAEIELKGPRDLVSWVDRTAEELIVARLTARFPRDGILGEESADSRGPSGGRFVVDPLDGTTNYLHGIPFFAVSIGYERDGVVTHGVVHAPATGETFAAEAGRGATLNGAPIRVSGEASMGAAIVATGFADARTSEVLRLTRLERVMNEAGCVRRFGAAALDLCYVAKGMFDGFWEWNLSPWDVAAGGLIVREAGGVVSDGAGGGDWLHSRTIVAGNAALHAALLALVRSPAGEPRLSRLQDLMRGFVAERNWEAFHQPKNLAMALAVEAAELAEIFQWLSSEASTKAALPPETRAHAGEELADVLAYALSMANALGLDLSECYLKKMEKNRKKYPVGGPRPEGWGNP